MSLYARLRLFGALLVALFCLRAHGQPVDSDKSKAILETDLTFARDFFKDHFSKDYLPAEARQGTFRYDLMSVNEMKKAILSSPYYYTDRNYLQNLSTVFSALDPSPEELKRFFEGPGRSPDPALRSTLILNCLNKNFSARDFVDYASLLRPDDVDYAKSKVSQAYKQFFQLNPSPEVLSAAKALSLQDFDAAHAAFMSKEQLSKATQPDGKIDPDKIESVPDLDWKTSQFLNAPWGHYSADRSVISAPGVDEHYRIGSANVPDWSFTRREVEQQRPDHWNLGEINDVGTFLARGPDLWSRSHGEHRLSLLFELQRLNPNPQEAEQILKTFPSQRAPDYFAKRTFLLKELGKAKDPGTFMDYFRLFPLLGPWDPYLTPQALLHFFSLKPTPEQIKEVSRSAYFFDTLDRFTAPTNLEIPGVIDRYVNGRRTGEGLDKVDMKTRILLATAAIEQPGPGPFTDRQRLLRRELESRGLKAPARNADIWYNSIADECPLPPAAYESARALDTEVQHTARWLKLLAEHLLHNDAPSAKVFLDLSRQLESEQSTAWKFYLNVNNQLRDRLQKYLKLKNEILATGDQLKIWKGSIRKIDVTTGWNPYDQENSYRPRFVPASAAAAKILDRIPADAEVFAKLHRAARERHGYVEIDASAAIDQPPGPDGNAGAAKVQLRFRVAGGDAANEPAPTLEIPVVVYSQAIKSDELFDLPHSKEWLTELGDKLLFNQKLEPLEIGAVDPRRTDFTHSIKARSALAAKFKEVAKGDLLSPALLEVLRGLPPDAEIGLEVNAFYQLRPEPARRRSGVARMDVQITWTDSQTQKPQQIVVPLRFDTDQTSPEGLLAPEERKKWGYDFNDRLEKALVARKNGPECGVALDGVAP